MKFVSRYQQLVAMRRDVEYGPSAWALGVHDAPPNWVLDDDLVSALFGVALTLDGLLARDLRDALLVEKAPGRPVAGLAGS